MHPPESIAGVRRFHRAVTRRAGVLEERFLGQDRPLGQSRVLYEIGPEGASLRDLRIRLGLDSGYLSRLVQGLSGAGLVVVERDEEDPRVRRATLTAAGRNALHEIDRRSDAVAREILDPLAPRQRERLVAAMETVVRLLGIADLRFDEVDPEAVEARWCLDRYFRELDERFEGGFSADRSLVADAGVFRTPHGAFLLGTIQGRPVACGALKFMDHRTGYIKRMWVDPSMRGTGLGRRLLSALEGVAAARGCLAVQLETHRALGEAQSLYRSAGYREVEPFNDELYADHWFEKALVRS